MKLYLNRLIQNIKNDKFIVRVHSEVHGLFALETTKYIRLKNEKITKD